MKEVLSLPYTTTTRLSAGSWEDAGAAAVMAAGAPIGSGLGIQNANNIRIIREFARGADHPDAGSHSLGRNHRDGARG